MYTTTIMNEQRRTLRLICANCGHVIWVPAVRGEFFLSFSHVCPTVPHRTISVTDTTTTVRS